MTDQQLAQLVWDYMRYEQPPAKVDLILGFGGPDIHTPDHCIDLYQAGWAPKIMFTGMVGRDSHDMFSDLGADGYAARALERGVPATDIIIEDASTNTGENVRFSHDMLAQLGQPVHSVILVTAPYALRRDYATFMAQWSDADKPTVICSAVPLSMTEYCAASVHDFTTMVNIMVGDLQRVMRYPALGYEIDELVPPAVRSAFQQLVERGYIDRLLPT